jgi:hypothetical protein
MYNEMPTVTKSPLVLVLRLSYGIDTIFSGGGGLRFNS